MDRYAQWYVCSIRNTTSETYIFKRFHHRLGYNSVNVLCYIRHCLRQYIRHCHSGHSPRDSPYRLGVCPALIEPTPLWPLNIWQYPEQIYWRGPDRTVIFSKKSRGYMDRLRWDSPCCTLLRIRTHDEVLQSCSSWNIDWVKFDKIVNDTRVQRFGNWLLNNCIFPVRN